MIEHHEDRWDLLSLVVYVERFNGGVHAERESSRFNLFFLWLEGTLQTSELSPMSSENHVLPESLSTGS